MADGSYLSRIYPSQRDRRHQRRGVCVRVIEYQLSGVADAEPLYRLLTTVLDAEDAPARELAALYHERWEIETAFDELKTHLRGARIVLAQQNARVGTSGVLGLDAGALCDPRPHVRSCPAARRRRRWTLLRA